jgi:hypothetical protein
MFLILAKHLEAHSNLALHVLGNFLPSTKRPLECVLAIWKSFGSTNIITI